MAVEMPVFTKTYVADEDLSAAQFHFVKASGNVDVTGCPKIVKCTAATDKPLGVLQEKPKNGESALVMLIGESKVVADAQLATIDADIGTSADGQLEAKTGGTTEYIVGRLSVKASGAGVYASAVINCVTPVKLGA